MVSGTGVSLAIIRDKVCDKSRWVGTGRIVGWLHGLGLSTSWLTEVGLDHISEQEVITLEAVHRFNLKTVGWLGWNKKVKNGEARLIRKEQRSDIGWQWEWRIEDSRKQLCDVARIFVSDGEPQCCVLEKPGRQRCSLGNAEFTQLI